MSQQEHLSQDQIAQNIIEQSPSIALCVTGPAGAWSTVFITRNISQLGYDRQDFMSGRMGWQDIVHPEDRDTLCEAVHQNEESGSDKYTLVYRILRADGQPVWVSDFSVIMRDANGQVLYTDSIVTDYTAIKEAGDRIEDYARQLEILGDIVEGLYSAGMEESFRSLLDLTGKYLDISRVLLFREDGDRRACQLVYEWCGQGVPSLMDRGEYRLDLRRDIPEIWDGLRRIGYHVISHGQIPPGCRTAFEQEGSLASAIYAVYSGEERWGFICFDECEHPRTWREETLAFLHTVASLVSSALLRKQSDEALSASRATMEAVLDNIPTYICVAEPQTGRMIFANRAHRETFPEGYSETPEFVGRVRELSAANPGGIFEVEQEGGGRWVSVQCGEIPWTDGSRMLLITGQDVTERRRHEEYIRRIAYMDHLTGLPNRYRCDVELAAALERSRQENRTGYLVYLDLDDFKIVNDGYGHDYGDALLIEFANFLGTTRLPGDQVFRQGGDEFVLLLHPDNAGEIDAVLRRLIERGSEPWTVMDKEFACTISAGVVAFPDGELGPKQLLKNADLALYEAKRLGKNAFARYSAETMGAATSRAELETLLRECIGRDFMGFSVHFLPWVELVKGAATGAEALLRWTSPSGRRIPPDQFLPLVEHMGLMEELGDFVLWAACTFVREVNDGGLPAFAVSVNLSLRQLQQQDILRRVEQMLEETGANPHNLVFEIGEDFAAGEAERIAILCGELRRMGIRVALDNFGDGPAALRVLHDLPLDVIKVDRSFIQGLGGDRYAHSFVRTVTDFGHALGKRVCIEGVETKAQLDYCRYAGADLVQGFYFFRPMPAEELLVRLLSRDSDLFPGS